jgi:hypothetical protein
MPLPESNFLENVMTDMENYKETMSNDKMASQLVNHLADLVRVADSDKSKLEFQMQELLITLVRNILLIPYQQDYKNLQESYKSTVQTKIYTMFSQSGGLFDALIYMCQDMSTEFMQNMSLTFLEIFYLILSSYTPEYILGYQKEADFIKYLQDKDRYAKIKRMNNLSTRHSRFGAMVSVKRADGTMAISSNPNIDFQKMNEFENQRRKPKAQARWFGKNNGSIFAEQIIDNNGCGFGAVDKNLRAVLQAFTEDFLQHAYPELINTCHQE